VPAAQADDESVVLRASRILDGKGGVLENRDVVVRGGRIAEIVPGGSARGDRVYDLTALTVPPGYINTHVHISSRAGLD
jgi:imidazolonepropionase-like amidohydrolase